ncbi:hypothetical protein ACLB2K_048085 [Fragaria x ananassa]
MVDLIKAAGSDLVPKEKGVQCYGCKEFGHIKQNCLRRKDGTSLNNHAGVAEDYGDVLTVSEDINTSPCDDWILDSGCTMHDCSIRDYFETFQESKGGRLFVANGVPCKIDGVGMVKIMMYDGVVRHLDDVAYVPEIRRNLISIGRMDSMECKCSVAGGAMEITRDNMVLVKGRKCDGLYCLEESTVLHRILTRVDVEIGVHSHATRNHAKGDAANIDSVNS